MNKKLKSHIQEFVFFAHKAAQHGLVRCGSGNLSCRIEQDIMLITSKGAWLSELTEDAVMVCIINDDSPLEMKQPSIEIGMHRKILQKRKECNVVLHCQSPYATAFACSANPQRDIAVIPEIPFYIGKPALVPYFNPGSKELAAAVAEVIGNHELVILQNHGQIAVGKDFNETLQRAVYFEFAAEIVIKNGNSVTTLSKEAKEYLYSKGGTI